MPLLCIEVSLVSFYVMGMCAFVMSSLNIGLTACARACTLYERAFTSQPEQFIAAAFFSFPYIMKRGAFSLPTRHSL